MRRERQEPSLSRGNHANFEHCSISGGKTEGALKAGGDLKGDPRVSRRDTRCFKASSDSKKEERWNSSVRFDRSASARAQRAMRAPRASARALLCVALRIAPCRVAIADTLAKKRERQSSTYLFYDSLRERRLPSHSTNP